MTASSARRSDDPEKALPPAPRSWRRGRTRPLVLVVDDTLDTRELYAMYFRHRGYDAVTASDGDEGIEIAVAQKPDVIVMDLAMPRVKGVSAMHHLKHDPRTRRIPVILLTAFSHHAAEQGALEMGADLFLTKPCLPEDLDRHVRHALTRRSA